MSIALTSVTAGTTVLLGAATQRLTGMGFALVSGPLLVLLLGAGVGVPLIQVLSFFVAASTLASTFRDVEWGRAGTLMLPAFVGILPGWWLVGIVPGPVLLIVIGLMVAAAIVAMLMSDRARVFKGPAGLASAGFLSGFMNYTAGVGGPAIVLYSLSNDWSHKAFVGTVQVYFMALNAMSLVGHGIPSLPMPIWLTAFVTLAVGILAGHRLARVLSAQAASKLVVVVALMGAVGTVAQGLYQLY